MDPSISDAIFNHSAAPSPSPGQQASNSTPPTATSTAVEGSPSAASPSSTSAPPSTDAPEAPIQSPVSQKRESVSLAGLENEVGQVLGSLRSFWGGVQKQVAPALESVRKDLSLAAVQAKAELERLQSQAADARARGEHADFANLAMMGSVGMATAPPTDSKDGSTPALTSEQKGKGKEVDPGPPLAEKLSSQAQTLFHRLQASLPTVPQPQPITTTTTNPDGTTTTTTTPAPPSATRSLPTLASFQSTLSSHLSSNPHLTLDLPALRASLTTNFQKLQTDLHLADAEKLAEEYLKKSEGVLKEAGRYLQEAVKVVPPIDGGETGTTGGVSWDGSDVWTLPSPASKLGGSVIFSQTDAQVAALTGLSTKSVRAKRKDALLRQLRSDGDVLEVDPGAEEGVDEDVRSLWKKWIKEEVEAQGGITGDEWTAKTWAELGPGGEGVEELKATRDALVPSKLTKDEFWTRYFFRVHQIETDEQRRKSLLDASAPADDELFSWDDEETSEAPATTTTTTTKPVVISTQPTASPTPPTAAPLASSAPTPTSPEPAQQTTPTSKSPLPAVRPEPTTVAAAPAPASAAAGKEGSTATSPRDSEESYDLVSETSGLAASSRAASSKGDEQEAPKKKVAPAAGDAEEDEDSDWE